MGTSLVRDRGPETTGTVDGRRDMIARVPLERRLRERSLHPRWHGVPPDAFVGITTDSREAGPGVLFCALRGSTFDGHDFVARAATAGAVAALVEEVDDSSLPQLRVSDSRAAAAHLAAMVNGDPTEDVELIGITGTNGKTTTALIARHLLAGRGPAGAIGTLGWFDTAGRRHPGQLTTPDPFHLMRTLGDLREEGARYVSLEVSSHALDQRRVAALEFRAGVFTNLTREHLDYHPDMASYRDAKLRLARHVASDGTCIVNADDPEWIAADFAGREVVRYGFAPHADVRATGVRLTPTGSEWTLATPEGQWPVRLPLLGEFNVHNALAAAAAARALEVEPGEAAEGLNGVPPVPGRMEVLSSADTLVLRDYMHTPDAYERVLRTLRGLVTGRLFIVFGCGGDRDRGKRPVMGRIAAELSDLAVITTDNPRSEAPLDICDDVTVDMPVGSYRVILDREEAIGFALGQAASGDIVVLAGKGHETYQEVAGERIPFDEADIVAGLTTGEP